MFDDVIEELASGDVFHDHEDIGGCADDLVEFDDVWVSEEFQVLDFSTNFT